MASESTTKKLHKLVRKASQAKFVKRGVKEVVKALRKGEKGFCIIAGDISPVDVITHLPIMCEDRGIPYLYVPSKHDLGAAATTKRPTSCVLVSPKSLLERWPYMKSSLKQQKRMPSRLISAIQPDRISRQVNDMTYVQRLPFLFIIDDKSAVRFFLSIMNFVI